MKEEKIPLLHIMLFLTNSLTAIAYNIINESLELIPMRIAVAVINGLGVSLITILIADLIHRMCKIRILDFILIVNLLILIAESFLLVNFYSLITPSILFSLINTNRNESLEFIRSYSSLNVGLLLCFIVLIFILGWKQRNKAITINIPHPFTKRSFHILLILSILISYSGLTYYVRNVRHMISYQMLTGAERVFHSIDITHRDLTAYQHYMRLAQQAPPITLTRNESDIPYVILILGESTSKWHMSAYGYRRNTTPLLTNRTQKKETVLFSNVQTSHTITYEAVPDIMTFHITGDEKKWYQYPTLPQIMKAAGYHTVWLSNQDSFTFGSENVTVSIANTADTTIFTYQRHASEEKYGYFDGAILPLLKQPLSEGHAKQFICIHLMGCHRRYTNRYPPSFNVFKPSEETKLSNFNQQKTIAEYDNSVLYTDFVCDEIIKLFGEKDALIIYFSDHGEEVYDTRNMCGHTPNNPTPPMTEVPLWIWTSNLFKSKRLPLQQRIEECNQNAYNTANTIHTIMDLCNLECEEYNRSKSLIFEQE